MALFCVLLIASIWFCSAILKDEIINDNFYKISKAAINSITAICGFIVIGYSGRDVAASLKGGYPPKDEKTIQPDK